jgi:outer membrane protein OmpA-like peptidoglycan-associated protein
MKKLYWIYILLLVFKIPLQAQEANLSQANDLMLKAFTASTHTKTEEQITKNIVDENTKQYFKKASKTYQAAYEKNKDNASINYKLGLCCYFSEDQQLKALPLLLKASKKLTNMYDFFSDKESNAPNNTLYFLASSYLEANKPDSALYYFSLYNDKVNANGINDDREIAMCYNAKDSEKHVRNVTVKNISSEINTSFAEKNPVVKLDNTLLFFSSNREITPSNTEHSEDIYFSKKELSGNWQSPQAFTYNTEYDEAPLYLSTDGTILYFKRTIKGNTDFYYSKLNNNIWSKPEPISELNTEANEVGLSITADGKKVFFSSDRNKSKGNYDLFSATLNNEGKWEKITILPQNINSTYNEVSPYINPDGQTLFFSSDGYENKGIGGFDIYYSELQADKSWSVPQSMQAPINSTRHDIGFSVTSKNTRYFSKLNNDKSYDIFEVSGEGFDFENIAAAEVVTVTKESGVTQVVETEKQVEKEVEVVTTVETEVEKIVEKEVQVAAPVEDLKNVKDTIEENAHKSRFEELSLDYIPDIDRQVLINKVKAYLSEKLKQNLSVSFKTVFFDYNKSELSILTIHELYTLIEFLKENPNTKVEVVGNTDNVGSWSKNLTLSQQRAQQVYNFLVYNGISSDRMYYYGRSSAIPLAKYDTDENRAKNRRVEVILIR